MAVRYTQEWPYGRVKLPGGGWYMREYGRSYPLPEALTEIRLSATPQVAPTVIGTPYTAIGGVPEPLFGVPRKTMAAGLVPIDSRFYSPVRLQNEHVGSKITNVEAPSSVKTDAQFVVKVDIETYGTGSDKQFLAIYDSAAGLYIGAGISDDPLPPGQTGTWTVTFNPLKDWYEEVTGRSIPATLQWKVVVGYVTKETPDGFEGVITDERNLPAISVEEIPPEEAPWWERYKYYLLAASAVCVVGLVVVARR